MINHTLNIKLEQEILRMRANKRNKIFLGLFLAFCLLTLACKIIDGVLLDLGFRNGSFNPGFWTNPNWIPTDKNDPLYYPSFQAEAHHPNTLWFLTQFTWITTLLIIVFIAVRIFMYQGTVPKWLKWIMTQRALSWVATFDIIVAVVFWASMFKGFQHSFNGDLREFEITYTVFVHALIPLFITIYAFIYLIKDKRASLLRTKFIWKGMIYISIYATFYLILTIVWTDPYPVSTMHKALVEKGWGEWAKELWKLPVVLFVVYSILGTMFIIHNFVLVKFNKNYNHEKDYEAGLLKQEHIDKYKSQVNKDIYARMTDKEKHFTSKIINKNKK